jgi:cytoskeletal protein CcmA (bactofilin family)
MFSKKLAETPRITTDRSKSMSAGTFSVIGTDVVIKGDIAASADLHVDGRIEGDIACSALVQGESSMIMGAIHAENARLAGHVNGSITARELVILKSARIEGDVNYDALTIEQGAEVEGRFAHRMTASSADSPADSSDGPGESGDEPRLTLAR